MDPGSPVGVILNPTANAGRALSLLPGITMALEAAGRPFQVHVTSGPGDATLTARRLVEQRVPVALAVGGDGTINEVANGLLCQDTTRLAIVPAGRGMDLLRSLGSQGRSLLDVEGLLAAPPRRIDLGLATFADGRRRAFVNVAGVGFDAEVAHRAARSRLPGRHTPYLAGLASAIVRYQNQEMTVAIDNHQISGTMRAVLVANGQYFGGGFHIVPSAALDDGCLDVAIIGDVGRLELLRAVPSLYRGEHTNHRHFRHLPAREVHVTASPLARVELDGEVEAPPPVTFSILPGGLWVAT
jgi:YegS/Rv2252/BmrU family lipid kinase